MCCRVPTLHSQCGGICACGPNGELCICTPLPDAYVLVIPLILGHEGVYGIYSLRGVGISPRGVAEELSPG